MMMKMADNAMKKKVIVIIIMKWAIVTILVISMTFVVRIIISYCSHLDPVFDCSMIQRRPASWIYF